MAPRHPPSRTRGPALALLLVLLFVVFDFGGEPVVKLVAWREASALGTPVSALGDPSMAIVVQSGISNGLDDLVGSEHRIVIQWASVVPVRYLGFRRDCNGLGTAHGGHLTASFQSYQRLGPQAMQQSACRNE